MHSAVELRNWLTDLPSSIRNITYVWRTWNIYNRTSGLHETHQTVALDWSEVRSEQVIQVCKPMCHVTECCYLVLYYWVFFNCQQQAECFTLWYSHILWQLRLMGHERVCIRDFWCLYDTPWDLSSDTPSYPSSTLQSLCYPKSNLQMPSKIFCYPPCTV